MSYEQYEITTAIRLRDCEEIVEKLEKFEKEIKFYFCIDFILLEDKKLRYVKKRYVINYANKFYLYILR